MHQDLNEIDWNRAIAYAEVGMETSWQAELVDLPQVVSARIGSRRIKTSSFFFQNGDSADSASSQSTRCTVFDPYAASESPSSDADPQGKAETKNNGERTRIAPPQDVIKLEDRLFYLLQPPLENLLGGKTLEFPFEPFNFQYAGIAFLFPRQSAILADEMGLGKRSECCCGLATSTMYC